MIFRTNKITNYTKIDNKYLEDKNISLKASWNAKYNLYQLYPKKI